MSCPWHCFCQKGWWWNCLILYVVSVKRCDGETVSFFMWFLSKEMMVKLYPPLCCFCPKRRWWNCLILYVVSVQRDDGDTVSSFILFLSKEMMVKLTHSLYCFCPKRWWWTCLILYVVSVKRDDGETLCGFCPKKLWWNCLILYVVSVKGDDGETVSFFILFLSKEMIVNLSHPLCCFSLSHCRHSYSWQPVQVWTSVWTQLTTNSIQVLLWTFWWCERCVQCFPHPPSLSPHCHPALSVSWLSWLIVIP